MMGNELGTGLAMETHAASVEVHSTTHTDKSHFVMDRLLVVSHAASIAKHFVTLGTGHRPRFSVSWSGVMTDHQVMMREKLVRSETMHF